jgi:tetratricopeptide (TPR) repeat protein
MPISTEKTLLARKYILLGSGLLAKGGYSAAEKYLRLAHAADPSCRQALELLAETERLRGRPGGAAFYLGAAKHGIDLRGTADTAQYYRRLAIEFEKRGDAANTRYCFAKFLEVSGEEPSADSVMACCVLAEYEKACKVLAALTSDPARRRSLSLLRLSNPWRFHNAHPPEYYRAHLRALRKVRPVKGSEGFLTFLEYTLTLNMPEADLGPVTRKLARLMGTNADKYDFARYNTGNAYLFSGKYEAAAKDYSRLLTAGYSDWPAYCRLGEAILCLGQTQKGLNCFEKAYAAASGKDKQSALVWAGQMLLFLKEYKQSLRVLERSQEHYASCWIGAAYYELGEIKKAVLNFERAVELVSGDVEARTWLGEVYRVTGRRAEALLQLEQAAQGLKEPGFWLCLNLGLLMRDGGDAAGLRKNYRLAAKSWPELISLVKKELGIGSKAEPDGAAMVKIMERALKLCGGYRRLDRHFLPLLVRQPRPARLSPTLNIPR